MHLLSLQPPSTTDAYVSGDVVIHHSAVIAPGVLLQADPNSQISIAAGVCIGMGAVLHSIDGRLEVGAGANLGAGVLLVGTCKIGEQACIGSASTIMNASISRGQVVPSGSLIGEFRDRVMRDQIGEESESSPESSIEPVIAAKQVPEVIISQHIEKIEVSPNISSFIEPTVSSFIAPHISSFIPPIVSSFIDPSASSFIDPSASSVTEPDVAPTPTNPPSIAPSITQGQAHLNKLMGKLFPHGQNLNAPPNLNSDHSSQ